VFTLNAVIFLPEADTRKANYMPILKAQTAAKRPCFFALVVTGTAGAGPDASWRLSLTLACTNYGNMFFSLHLPPSL
jgi:hypothetical protein